MSETPEVMSFQQMSTMESWRIHQELIKDRVRKTLARERTLKRDFREVSEFTEIVAFYRFGVGGKMVQCTQAEASTVLFIRKERFL